MEEQVAQILAKIQGAVTTLAPEVWQALVAAARIDGLLSLAFSIVLLTITTVWTLKFKTLYEWSERDGLEPLIIIPTLVLAGGSIVAFIMLFSSDMWLGIFYPEAAVIRDLISKAAS